MVGAVASKLPVAVASEAVVYKGEAAADAKGTDRARDRVVEVVMTAGVMRLLEAEAGC